MGDLLGFEGYLNTSTPFNPKEHNFVWKGSRQYHDFHPGNIYLEKCDYPRFWGDDGREVTNTSSFLVGCRDSEFDQVALPVHSWDSRCSTSDVYGHSMAKSLLLDPIRNGNARYLSLLSFKIVCANGAAMSERRLNDSLASRSLC